MTTRGELEQRVLELLWASDVPVTVADVHGRITAERELAYTTVMTVLDRLAKKGLVDRDLVARAWRYRARYAQDEVVAEELGAVLDGVPHPVRVQALRRFAGMLAASEREALAADAPVC